MNVTFVLCVRKLRQINYYKNQNDISVFFVNFHFYSFTVVLPPTKEDKTGTKILTMDRDSLCEKRIGSETTDDNNKSRLNVEVCTKDKI